MIRRVGTFLALSWVLAAQTRIPFTCTEEDTREAGLTCSDEQPCKVFLELSGIEATLNRVFLAGNLHTADTTLYSILLASSDGGKSWTEPSSRIRHTSLEQIQFIDFETGWVSGTNVQGLPRDPFLLITDDGGQTWKQRPVFDESRTGLVERFWFDSKTSGALLIDTKLRHELYESMTGGESWSLRQSSKQALRLPRERTAAEPSIRIRTDAKIHGYQIEKRQDGKWLNVGTFLVEVGQCKN